MAIETASALSAMGYGPYPNSDAANAYSAFLKAQKEIANPVKDSVNPHFKNKYASLEQVIEVCKTTLMSNGFVVQQQCKATTPGFVSVQTRFIHAPSGGVIITDCDVPIGKMDPQGGMSAFTYGRRYGLKAALCLADEDDDAEIASNIPVTNKAVTPPQTKIVEAKNPFAK